MKISYTIVAFMVLGLAANIRGTTDVSGMSDVAVVVNPSNPITGISSLDLHRIFAGDKIAWNGSLAVIPFVRAAEARERHVLLDKVMRMSESEYRNYWLHKIYGGAASREPLALYSNGMVLEAVRSEKGGIALIHAADVKSGVKVIKVDGFLPGSQGYPLH
jgi:hypothetical protein